MSAMLPACFLGHGNPMNALADNADSQAWRVLARGLPRPRAILMVSAHWRARGLAVVTGDHDALIDYPALTAEADRATPSPEHFLPLLYIAALADPGETPRFLNNRIEYGCIGMLGFGYGLTEPA